MCVSVWQCALHTAVYERMRKAQPHKNISISMCHTLRCAALHAQLARSLVVVVVRVRSAARRRWVKCSSTRVRAWWWWGVALCVSECGAAARDGLAVLEPALGAKVYTLEHAR